MLHFFSYIFCHLDYIYFNSQLICVRLHLYPLSKGIAVTEYVVMLHRLLCLYCEKTFKDRFTLKEHMRKKLHKKLNPNNKEYDEFYLVNYLVGGGRGGGGGCTYSLAATPRGSQALCMGRLDPVD